VERSTKIHEETGEKIMENKKLLAEALLKLAKSSTTVIVEAAEDKELIDAASKLGIVLPSPDLAVLKTVYAEIDKVNLNGVVLSRKAVEAGLPTLIGKQMNWEHLGAYNVCGYIINSSIKEDKIEIIAVVFKSLFPEEFDIVQEKFKKGTLAVSFEIWNVDPTTHQSVVSELADGNVEINPIIFHGCGLLLTSAPACPKAKIYKLLAKKEEDKSFTEDLVFARMAIEEPKCLNCENCTCEKEVKIVEEIKKDEEIKSETALVVIPEEKVEEKKEEVVAEVRLCPECKQPLKEDEEEICAVCKTKKEEEKDKAEIIPETKVEETKLETEVKLEEVAKTTPEETKVEDEVKPEVVEEIKAEEANVITKTEVEVQVVETSPELDVVTTEKKTTEVVVDESGKVLTTKVEEEKTVETFSFEQLTEKVQEAKVELQKIVEAQLVEIAKLKEELEAAKQPKEIVKASEEETTQADLTVGEVNTTGEDLELKRQKDNVNKFIASKHKK
jgi:hypothetical protein